MNERYITWNEHPLNVAMKTNNRVEVENHIQFYLEQLYRSGFITNEEIQIIQLMPYTNKVTIDLLRKSEIALHKLLFKCQEQDFFPMILQAIIKFAHEIYKEGYMRRKIYHLILDTACYRQKEVIKGYAYKGCISGNLIRCFHLERLYQSHPALVNALEYTRLDQSMFKKEKK